MSEIGWWATAGGEYILDEAIKAIRKHWRDGRQIVILVGAGISVQSGFPALSQLGLHLLKLDALRKHKMYIPPINTASAAQRDKYMADVYSLLRDGWSCPFLFQELYNMEQVDVVRRFLNHRMGKDLTVPYDWSIHQLKEFAQESLGLNWFQLLDRVAEDDPRLIELLIDDIGTHVIPGAAHNLLSQFVAWFNVKLILTTNFDSLIEDSLRAEGQYPYVFDVHVSAPPPPRLLVRPHLSVLKLHGSHYGIRADRTIDTPLDPGHQHAIAEYFEPDALLLILDYSGSDKRLMELIRHLMSEDIPTKKGHREKNHRTIVRIDGIATAPKNKFFELAQSNLGRVRNVYYPHSRLFLLDALQKCSGKFPNTWKGYPAVPQTPAPFKERYMFGCEPDYNIVSDSPPMTRGTAGESPSDAITAPANQHRFAVVMGIEGAGVSQQLAQVAETLYRSHQMLWCDVDEAISVGTLVSYLYSFAVSRQPELPNVPLPLNLPIFDPTAPHGVDLDYDSLLRTAKTIWNRLKRENYLIIIDSVSYGVLQLLCLAEENDDPRLRRKAARMILFIAMLCWCADVPPEKSQCLLLVGTHVPNDAHEERLMQEARQVCCEALNTVRFLHSEADEIRPYVSLLSDDKCTELTNEKKYTLQAEQAIREYRLTRKHRDWASFHPWIEMAVKHDWPTAGTVIEQLRIIEKTPNTPDLNRPFLPLGRFLYEASLCNRPRSWCQLLALPVVEAFSLHFQMDGNGDRTRALTELVNLSVDCGFLRPQPGAFYYMDGTLRKLLRVAGSTWTYKSPKGINVTGCARVHEKMLRYYERAYNVSGDITALNYFYYHSQEYLTACKKESIPQMQIIEELTRGLLENSKYARKHLNVYDHVFLLLRVRDLISKNFLNSSTITDQENGRVISVLNNIDSTLRDIYDDAENFRDGFGLQQDKLLSKQAKFPSGLWRERQELYARAFDLYRSCIAGAIALLPREKISNSMLAIARERSGSPNANLQENAVQVILLICEVIQKGITRGDGSNLDWLEWVREQPRRIQDTLYSLIRLARSVTRLDYYGGIALSYNGKKVAEILVSVGKELLAGISDQTGIDTKFFWARYHNASAYCSLHQIDKEAFLDDGFSHVYRTTSLAKSYAIRAEGVLGDAQRAIAAVQMAEALIWEGRLLMASGKDARQSTARQTSALRELSEARKLITNSRLALAWWREITVLTCTVTNDIIRANIQGRDAAGGDILTDSEFLVENATRLKTLAMDVCFLRAVVWNDPWRQIRLSYQLLRIIFYSGWLFTIARDLYQTSTPAVSQQATKFGDIIAASADLLGALRMIGGLEAGVPLLPKRFDDIALQTRPDNNWIRDLTSGVTKLTDETINELKAAKDELIERTQGAVQKTIDTIELDIRAMKEIRDITKIGHLPDQQKWSEICERHPLRADQLGYGGL